MDNLDKAIEQFNAGNLPETIELCNDGLRNKPKDIDLRVFLTQALAFDGNWDRMEKLCDQIMGQSKESRSTFFFATVTKNLVQGERLRAEVWNEGVLPELMTEKDDLLETHLRGWTENLAGNVEQAQKSFEDLSTNQTLKAKCNAGATGDFADIDLATSKVFEFLLPTGGYVWFPMNQVRRIEFSEVTRPLDQCWRQANITLKDERTLYAYQPCLYFDSYSNDDAAFKLGRMTDWIDCENRLSRAAGRRIFSVGDDEMCAMQVSSIEFEG